MRGKRAILLLLIFLLFVGCGQQNSRPVPVDGFLDLRNQDPDQMVPMDLNGTWAFYWGAGLGEVLSDSLQGVPIEVPGYWNAIRHEGQRIGSDGFGSYRLRIALPKTDELWGLELKTIGTAYRAFVNGEYLSQGGRVGTDRTLSHPGYEPALIPLHQVSDEADLIIEVSNFHHRNGGLWEPVRFGPLRVLQEEHEAALASSLFLLGTIFIMGIYHLGIYSLQARGRAALYFGLFCLDIALRELVTGQVYILQLFPNINWQIIIRLEYFSFYMGIPLFFLILYTFFPRDLNRRVLQAILIIGGIGAATVLVLPVTIFSRTLLIYQLFTAAVALYAIYGLLKAFIRAEEGAAIVLIGFLAVILAFLNDVLYARNILPTGYLISLGVLIFIFSQAFLISLRVARAYGIIETQSRELEKTNRAFSQEIETRKAAEKEVLRHRNHLEELVRERTNELEEANQQLRELSLLDGLTKIANRRRLDEEMDREWRRMRREGRPLAFILCDIDYFKRYNDTYGHQEGDAALIKVATAIRQSVKRPGDLAARYGGEEFCLIAPETDLKGAMRLAEIVRKSIADLRLPHRESDVSPFVTLSMGVSAGVPRDDDFPADLIERADQALYKAKAAGRNRVISMVYGEEPEA